jgi:RNAse (barnase) inhibitor barstar
MFKEDSYIKSIEKYFLTHLGKGIMLSYSDYELIASWKDKNIPLETIMEGIREAFSDYGNINSLNKETKIRNLNSISSYVDKSIKMYLEIENIDCKIEDNSSNNYINNIIKSINQNIEEIEDKRVLEKVLKYKNLLINLNSEKNYESFNIINEQENRLYDDIFNLLSESDKNKILTKCENKLKNNSNITNHAYRKSITSFRNEIVKDMFNLKFLN